MVPKKSGKKNTVGGRNFLIGTSVVAILSIAALASIFGYSLRASIYSGSVSPSPDPSPSQSPTCTPLTPGQIANIRNHMNNIAIQINGINRQILAAEEDQSLLNTDFRALVAQYNATTNINRRNILMQQRLVVSNRINELSARIQAMNNQINQLREQINQLQRMLQTCNPQGSPQPA